MFLEFKSSDFIRKKFYTGGEDGHFWKISPDGTRTVVGRSPGRPLALKLTHDVYQQ